MSQFFQFKLNLWAAVKTFKFLFLYDMNIVLDSTIPSAFYINIYSVYTHTDLKYIHFVVLSILP